MRTIYKNAVVDLGNGRRAQAFAVEGGRFAAVGDTGLGPADAAVDLGGAYVCAGFNDSHMHLLNYGGTLAIADLAAHTGSLEEVVDTMRAYAAAGGFAPGEWVRGRGWNQDYFSGERRFPTRKDLDAVSTELPVCLTRACGHACVVNSKGLALTGVTAATPQPAGGLFELGADGRPNGIFRENAMELVSGCIPRPTVPQLKERLRAAMAALNRHGVTSCQTDDFTACAGVPWQDVVAAYRELEAEGAMTVRVNQQAQLATAPLLQEFLDAGYCTGWGSAWFRIGPLKLVGDGSLGARTAYLSAGYADAPDTRGLPLYTRRQLAELIGLAHTHGMQVAVHAIGDAILDDILTAYESVLAAHPRADHRHGVVHCQITRPDQLRAFARLGLHAYAQPIFLDYDMRIVTQRVGPVRAATSYAFKTLRDMGVAVSFGTDCPVEAPRPLACIQCAVTRQNLEGTLAPYRPEESFTVDEALDAYTVQGAAASFEEKEKGRIAPGYLADFVVLGQDPHAVDPHTVKDIPVRAAYVGGRCVFAE